MAADRSGLQCAWSSSRPSSLVRAGAPIALASEGVHPALAGGGRSRVGVRLRRRVVRASDTARRQCVVLLAESCLRSWSSCSTWSSSGWWRACMGIGYGGRGRGGGGGRPRLVLHPADPRRRRCRTPRTRSRSSPTWSPAPCSVSWRRPRAGGPSSPRRGPGARRRAGRPPEGGHAGGGRVVPRARCSAAVTEEVGKPCSLRPCGPPALRDGRHGDGRRGAGAGTAATCRSAHGGRRAAPPSRRRAATRDVRNGQDGYAEAARSARRVAPRAWGCGRASGSPVVVEGRLWGVMIGASYAAEPIAEGPGAAARGVHAAGRGRGGQRRVAW